MDNNYALVLVIGILGSSVIHFSQGLMRLAIMRKAGEADQSRTRRIYIAGVALNFTAGFFQVLINLPESAPCHFRGDGFYMGHCCRFGDQQKCNLQRSMIQVLWKSSQTPLSMRRKTGGCTL